MAPHQQRVVDEASALNEKRVKLEEFIRTNAFFAYLVPEEQARLRTQLYYMDRYSDVLAERIAAF